MYRNIIFVGLFCQLQNLSLEILESIVPHDFLLLFLLLFLLIFYGLILFQDTGSNNSGYYELTAVLTHQGRSSSSGHYVGWVRKKDGTGT